MYAFLCSRLPRIVVDVLYAVWYATLMIMVYYFFDRAPIGFFYLHR